MEQYAPRVITVLKGQESGGRGALFLTAGGVPPIPDVVYQPQPQLGRGYIYELRILAGDPRVDTIVIGARWSAYFAPGSGYVVTDAGQSLPLACARGRHLAYAAFDCLMAELAKLGKHIVLVEDNPSGRALDPRVIYQRGFLDGGISIHDQGVATSDALAREAELRRFLEVTAATRHLGLIDPFPFLAHGDRIPALSHEQVPIYKDTHHLRASFVREYVRYLDATIGVTVP